MFIPLLILGFSAWLLVWSSNLMINQSKELAFRLKISKLFVALVLVSLGTSLPELTVSGVAMSRGDPGLSIGNILGSNITNTTLVLGMAILINHMTIGRYKTQQNAWLLLVVTFSFIVLFGTPLSGTVIGGILLGMTIGTISWQYLKAVHGREHEDKHIFIEVPHHHESIFQLVAKVFIALLGLMFSGTLLVFSIQSLSIILGISTTVLGLTIAALATSLPELVATLIAQKQKEEKIALGNILGSNIYNLLFVGGMVAFNLGDTLNLGFEAILLALVSIVMFVIIKRWKGNHVPKWVGVSLILGYSLYITTSYILNL